MRHPASLLCLLVALTGTPLRQAEAADDAARSFAELLEPANIEPPDGGVGDDPGVGTLDEAQHGLAPEVSPATDILAAPPSLTPCPTSLEAARLRRGAWRPQSAPGVRHAWLQTFLL